MWEPVAARLPDGRLHLQQGPIDLVIQVWGEPREVSAAYDQARARFADILPTLVEELPLLRQPIGESPAGPVAQRMRWACLPFCDATFITPMAAVAGAVADEMLAATIAGRRLEKAIVNNGGDIAFHLAPGASFSAGLVADPDTLEAAGRIEVGAAVPARGLATSGRHGRSLTRGIADAVTVLAANAASADAAATLIANAVDCDDPAIRRQPAREIDPDSDLGALPVTVALGALGEAAISRALAGGLAAAELFRAQGLIEAASLSLRGQRRTTAAFPTPAIRSVPA